MAESARRRDPLAPAVHRSIVVFDVEGFGSSARQNILQGTVRLELYKILARRFRRSGLSWASWDQEDRRGGVPRHLPPAIPDASVAASLPGAIGPALGAGRAPARPARARPRAFAPRR